MWEWATRVHCPVCGSYYVHGYAKRERVNRGNGVYIDLKCYVCGHCGERFNDDAWQLHCDAPPRRPHGRKLLQVKVSSTEERAQLLEHLDLIHKLKDLPEH